MSFPTDLQELLVKLEFLSQVKQGDKINTKEMSFSPKDSWISSLKRTYSREDRKLTLQYIKDVVRDTTDILDRYKDEKDYYNIIKQSFTNAKSGIENLLITYKDSPEIISVLRVIIKDMELQIK